MYSAIAKVNLTPMHAATWPRKSGADRASAMGG
jgi:hypothetical protein